MGEQNTNIYGSMDESEISDLRHNGGTMADLNDHLLQAKSFLRDHQGRRYLRSGIGIDGFDYDLVETKLPGEVVNILYCHQLGVAIYPEKTEHPFPEQARPQILPG